MSMREAMREAMLKSTNEDLIEKFESEKQSGKKINGVDLSVDGETHIWISPIAATDIGRLIYLNWRARFYVPQLGNFGSVANFSRWVITFDETIRFGKVPTGKVDGKDIGLLVNAAQKLGKYHQLCAYTSNLVEAYEKGLFELDWYAYKRHRTGVKELQKKSIQDQVKEFKKIAELIVKFGPKEAIEHDNSIIRARDIIMNHVKENFDQPETLTQNEDSV